MNNIEEAMAGALLDSVKVTEDGADLKKMTEQIGLLATKFDTSLASLATRLDTSLASLETKFDTSLTSLETRLDTSLASLETRLDAHDASLATLTGQMADCMDRLAGVEERYERYHTA
jgi:uncharacterized coiled-coil protein SlyX